MNDIARQLRAQIPWSTDPDRLERMAREAESRVSPRQSQAHQGSAVAGTGHQFAKWCDTERSRFGVTAGVLLDELHEICVERRRSLRKVLPLSD